MTEAVLDSPLDHTHYAGFWVRFFAACVDLAFYTPIYIGMRYVFDALVNRVTDGAVVSKSMMSVDYLSMQAMPSDIYHWWFEAVFAMLAIISYTWFFASRWQASPGMLLMRFHITDAFGRRISYARAFMWCITSMAGWLICGAGVLYMQKDINTVFEMLAGCGDQNIDLADCVPEIEKEIGISYSAFEQLVYTATGITLFMFLIWALSIALPKDKTGFHNLICGTRFVKGRA